MPTFPTYRGELPPCLNPLNPRHYLLLAYWVYFRPTALKCYLYQADPKLYKGEGRRSISSIWSVPAYRYLCAMAPMTAILLSVLVKVPLVLAASWVQLTPISWWGATVGMIFGVVIGMVGGLMFGLAGGLVFTLAGSLALGLTGGLAFSVTGGLTLGLGGSLAFGLALGLVFGLALNTTGSLAFGLAGGLALGLAGGLANGVIGSMMVDATNSVAVGVVASLASVIGSLRLIFYLFQIGPAWLGTTRSSTHPVEWDELIVLPLPNTWQMLHERLQGDEPAGLHLVASVAGNPFQRWAAQGSLNSYLHENAKPLHLLYHMLADPDLNAYILAPLTKRDWEQLPTSSRVLLGELDGRWVDVKRPFDRLVWRFTRHHDLQVTPLTRFAGMLYELLDEKAIDVDRFDLSPYREIYNDLTGYPEGKEIAYSFGTLDAFLSYDSLPKLAEATSIASSMTFTDAPIRPKVLDLLARLGEIGAEVVAYRDATSRVNKLAALARATNELDRLDQYVSAEVLPPEQAILRRIIRQWRKLIGEVGGEIGRESVAGPVANPYVAGNPVVGALFVGREDILRHLEELWAKDGPCPSVVLYGHRRMGKTSILHNLGARFGTRTTVVNFNMQRVGLVANTGELLYSLALELYDGLLMAQRSTLAEPDEQRFSAHNPYTAFDRFLKELDRISDKRRMLITVDEFELIEELISEGKLEPRLLDFWRALIQTYPWFVMAFAGLHTLQEMTEDYWHPLFGSVTAIPVSFLGQAAATQLIVQPTPDFDIDYDAEAIERIIALAGGQPYLTQLVCHGLITRFNREMFENPGFTFPVSFPIHFGRERRFTLADVEAVIGAPEFYRDGDAYFTGVWRQAEQDRAPGQTAILRVLAGSEDGLREEDLIDHAGLDLDGVRRALAALERHDLLIREGERWRFTVELMRRWVARRAAP